MTMGLSIISGKVEELSMDERDRINLDFSREISITGALGCSIRAALARLITRRKSGEVDFFIWNVIFHDSSSRGPLIRNARGEMPE